MKTAANRTSEVTVGEGINAARISFARHAPLFLGTLCLQWMRWSLGTELGVANVSIALMASARWARQAMEALSKSKERCRQRRAAHVRHGAWTCCRKHSAINARYLRAVRQTPAHNSDVAGPKAGNQNCIR